LHRNVNGDEHAWLTQVSSGVFVPQLPDPWVTPSGWSFPSGHAAMGSGGGKDPGKIHTDRRINVELLAMNAESAVSMPMVSVLAVR